VKSDFCYCGNCGNIIHGEIYDAFSIKLGLTPPWCADCRRMEQMIYQQKEIANESAKESQKNDIRQKILNCAIDAIDNPQTNKKKIKVILKSPFFINNECELFEEIKSNLFLSDSYYHARLGSSPTINSIKKLPNYAMDFITEWANQAEDEHFSKKVLNLYLAYRTELDAEQKRQEEEEKRSEQKRKRQEARQRKEDQAKKNEYSDFIEQNFGHNRGFVKTEDIQKKQTSNRFGEYISYLFISLIAIWFIYSVFTEISNLMQSQPPR
jgi:hypothetical protein